MEEREKILIQSEKCCQKLWKIAKWNPSKTDFCSCKKQNPPMHPKRCHENCDKLLNS